WPSRIEFKKIASNVQFVSSLVPPASLGEQSVNLLDLTGQFITDATAQDNCYIKVQVGRLPLQNSCTVIRNRAGEYETGPDATECSTRHSITHFPNSLRGSEIGELLSSMILTCASPTTKGSSNITEFV